MYGSPTNIRGTKAVRQLKLIFHPELRKGIGAWDFRGKEGNPKIEKQMFGKQMFIGLTLTLQRQWDTE